MRGFRDKDSQWMQEICFSNPAKEFASFPLSMLFGFISLVKLQFTITIWLRILKSYNILLHALNVLKQFMTWLLKYLGQLLGETLYTTKDKHLGSTSLNCMQIVLSAWINLCLFVGQPGTMYGRHVLKPDILLN